MTQAINCEQGSDEWRRYRLGIPTASMFSAILAKPKDPAKGALTRASYMRRLAGEIITGQPAETFRSAEMDRGTEMEAEARAAYATLVGGDVQPAGMFRNELAGCSPDSLVGDKGLLEIKTKKPELLVAVIDADKFPAEHVAQCQGQLWVCEREWVDLAVYYTGMPLFVKRAERDEQYIAQLQEAVAQFNAELSTLVESIRAKGVGTYQVPPGAAAAARAMKDFEAVDVNG